MFFLDMNDFAIALSPNLNTDNSAEDSATEELAAKVCQNMCAEQVTVVVQIEARQLGNGIDIPNRSLEVSDNFTSLAKRRKTILYCCFTETKRDIQAEVFMSNMFTNCNYRPLKGNIFDLQGI